VIELARRFVCAADEVWRLQRGSEADCVLFQKMVNDGRRITDRGTRQGTYVFAPGGKLLARTSSRDVDAFVETLERGLAAWRELPDADKHLPEGLELQAAQRWEMSYPEGGLVLERIARDLDEKGLAGRRGERWNRDFAWFAPSEIVLDESLQVGESVALATIARRLARFHLVDNVRGQTLPYADEELLQCELTGRVSARAESTVELELEGATRAVAQGPWLMGANPWKPGREIAHSLAARLGGRATYDLDARRFVSFELVAVGRREGRTQNNARRDASGLVAFHLQAAPAGARIAPTFIALYAVDWVLPPGVPTWVHAPAECGLDE
jgi:hypothetical protein